MIPVLFHFQIFQTSALRLPVIPEVQCAVRTKRASSSVTVSQDGLAQSVTKVHFYHHLHHLHTPHTHTYIHTHTHTHSLTHTHILSLSHTHTHTHITVYNYSAN